ncbi:BofC C-terminal domain-containing protein [Clostridiaceae bacterium 35-E11]
MFRRRRRGKKLIVGCFVLLLIGFIYGYVFNNTPTPNKPNDSALSDDKNKKANIDPSPNTNNEENKQEIQGEDITEDLVPIIDNDNITTNNTRIIFKTYFEKTRDTITKEKQVPINLVGTPLDAFKDYLEENYENWTIRECTKDVVELYRTINEVSPNHYIAKDYNGYIAIFKVDENGNSILFKQTDIPISSLSDVDRNKLQEGIVVKGVEGINQILEDYSS